MADAPTPPAAQEDNTITIKIFNSNSGELTFKVKKSTPFSKIIKAWADKNGVQQSTFKFSFDGDQLDPTKCPMDYDMEEGDTIDAMPIQTGGE